MFQHRFFHIIIFKDFLPVYSFYFFAILLIFLFNCFLNYSEFLRQVERLDDEYFPRASKQTRPYLAKSRRRLSTHEEMCPVMIFLQKSVITDVKGCCLVLMNGDHAQKVS